MKDTAKSRRGYRSAPVLLVIALGGGLLASAPSHAQSSGNDCYGACTTDMYRCQDSIESLLQSVISACQGDPNSQICCSLSEQYNHVIATVDCLGSCSDGCANTCLWLELNDKCPPQQMACRDGCLADYQRCVSSCTQFGGSPRECEAECTSSLNICTADCGEMPNCDITAIYSAAADACS